MKASVLAEPILVGRERELEELMRYLDVALKGKGTTVFVSGEAGTGKTRLTTEFLKTAKQKRVLVLSGWCLSDAAVPYFPFVRAFDTYFSKVYHEEPSESPSRTSCSANQWSCRNRGFWNNGLAIRSENPREIWKDWKAFARGLERSIVRRSG